MWKPSWKWLSLKWISWQWLYNHKYLGLSLEAQRLALAVDLERVQDEKEKAALKLLLMQAGNASFVVPASGKPTPESLILYVQRHHYLSAGAGQVVLPIVGLFGFLALLGLVALVVCLLPDDKVDAIRRGMLGLGTVTFFAILVAGSAGGTIRVLLTSLGRGHPSRSVLGLIFTGFLWPAVGAVLGLILVEAFQSGFLPVPIQDGANTGSSGLWTKAQHFVILAAFLGGFAESALNKMVGRIVPSPPAG